MKKLDLTQPSEPEVTQETLQTSPEVKAQAKHPKLGYLWVAVVLMVSLGLGVATGLGAAKLYSQDKANSSQAPITQVPEKDQIKPGDIFGSEDAVFADEAEGYLESGGIDGEGSHKLLRPGGPSQTVYLTSSVTDLDKFVGMQVRVYGETYKGQKAGWLMDVGKVKVINPQGEKPAETWEL